MAVFAVRNEGVAGLARGEGGRGKEACVCGENTTAWIPRNLIMHLGIREFSEIAVDLGAPGNVRPPTRCI